MRSIIASARSILAAVAFIILIITPSFAQEGTPEVQAVLPDYVGEPYRLVYDHVSATFTLYDDDGREVRGWRAVPASHARLLAAPIPPSRALEVAVTNANSLVYEYAISAAAVSGSPRVRACRDLGRDFFGQAFFTTTRSILGADTQIPALDVVQRDLEGLTTASPGVEKEIGFESSNRRAVALNEAKQGMLAYRRLNAHISTLAETLDDSIQSIAARADAEPIDGLIADLLASIERDYPNLKDPRYPPLLVQRSVRAISEQLARAGGPNAGDYIGTEVSALTDELKASLPATNAAVKAVQRGLLRLARARAAARQSTMLLPAELGRQIVISVKPIEGDSGDLDVLPVRAGEVTTYTRARSGMLCQLSVGVNWTRPGASYKLDRDGVIIDQTSDDEIRTAAAVLFSFGPAALPQLGILTGIGLGTGGRPDLYLGGSVRVLTPLLINAGALFQREQLLPGGLAPGDTVPADFRDFDRAYRASFFFGLSFGR